MFSFFGGSKRPNTQIPFTLYKHHDRPMPECPLKPDAWEKALEKYSDKNYTKSLVGMLRYGALIGYTGSRLGQRIYKNHGSAREQPELLENDLREQLGNNRLAVYTARDRLPNFFVSSPIGLVDKNDGNKRRVHDLSFPDDLSVNAGIHGERTKVVFSTLQDIMAIMKEVGTGCIFIKRDFKDAYRHIPISPVDSVMLGFAWEDEFFVERFLPFGLSSAPFLFNFVAEGFHWILEQRLKPLKGKVIHYLDDFLIVLPKGSKLKNGVRIFDETAEELGFVIKTSKNREGEVTDFVGFELDSKRMVARLAQDKLEKTRMLVTQWVNKETISTKQLEHLLGKLDRASKVVPVGRTHCRDLIALQDQAPPGSRGRVSTTISISDGARKELEWWRDILTTNPHIKVVPSTRRTIEVFTNASGFKGMGGYYLKDKQSLASLPAEQFFMKPHPERNNREKDLLPKEMMVVEEALILWGPVFKGFSVVFNTSCQGVAFGLLNHTIHGNGAPLDTLKRILLLGQKHDVDIWSHWIPNDDNELAICLSRFERPRIHALAPKLGVLRAERGDLKVGSHNPKADPQPPKAGSHPPKADPQPPKAGSHPPKTDPQPPKAGSHPLKTDPQPPKVGSRPPKAGSHPPKTDPQPRRAGSHPPKVDPQPPKAGSRPPKVGSHPPKAGSQPPKAGSRPPKADSHPPKAGSDPLKVDSRRWRAPSK